MITKSVRSSRVFLSEILLSASRFAGGGGVVRGVAMAGLLGLGPVVAATTQWWDTNGTAAGNGTTAGTWGTSSFWATLPGGGSSTGAYLPNSDVVFSAVADVGPTTVGVIGTQTANSLTFDQLTPLVFASSGAGVVKVGAGGITLASSSGGVLFDSVPSPLPIQLGASQTWTNNANTDLEVGAVTAANASVVLNLSDSGTAATGRIVLQGVVGNGTSGAVTGLTINRTNPAGMVNLGGANTFTGGITLTAGFLQVSNAAAFGGPGNTVNLDGGSIIASLPQTLTNTGTYRIGGNFTVGGKVGTTDFPGKIKLASGTLDVLGGTRTITLYAGNPSVTVGTAQLGLQTTSVVSTGGAGVLRVAGGTATSAAGPGIFSFEGVATFASGVGFSIGNKAATVFSGANLIGGTPDITVETSGFLNLSDGTAGSQSQTIGALNGAGTVLNDTTGTGTAVLTIGGADAGTFSGVIRDGGFGQTGGKVALVVNKANAAASQVLTGTNTYSGTTTVTSGILLVNGSNTGGGACSVASGGTLGGTGSIDAAVNVSGTIAPGAAGIGTLSTGAVTFAVGATLAIEINTATAAADQLVVAGNVATGGNAVNLTLTDIGGNVALPIGTKLVVVSYSGVWNVTDVLSFGGVPVADGATLMFGANTFTVAYADISLGGTVMTLTAAKTPFQNWIDGFAAQLPNPADRLPDADPDGDGRDNLLEFAFDGNPADITNNGRIVFSTTDPNAPGLSVTLAVRNGAVAGAGPNNSITLTADGIVYLIEGSETLNVFDKAIEEVSPATPLVPAPDAGWTARTFRISDSAGLPDKRFLRVGVRQQ